MNRRGLLFLGIMLCMPALAHGAITITAGNHTLLPNTAGQVVNVTIKATAGESANSADMFTKINGGLGGLPASAFFPPEAPAVTLIALNTATTMFNTAPFGSQLNSYPAPNQVSPTGSGTLAARSVSANADPDTDEQVDVPIPANGILARLTISTVGIMQGPADKIWSLELNNGLGDSTLSNSVTGNLQGVITLVDGSLKIIGTGVPEPSSVVLGLFAVAGLAVVAVRRRRAA